MPIAERTASSGENTTDWPVGTPKTAIRSDGNRRLQSGRRAPPLQSAGLLPIETRTDRVSRRAETAFATYGKMALNPKSFASSRAGWRI